MAIPRSCASRISSRSSAITSAARRICSTRTGSRFRRRRASVGSRMPSRPDYAVGYYRSHTRDGLSLAPEDLAILDQCFPGTGARSAAGEALSEPGSARLDFSFAKTAYFPIVPPLEFPFRRRELTGEEPPPRRSLTERRPRRREPSEHLEAREIATRRSKNPASLNGNSCLSQIHSWNRSHSIACWPAPRTRRPCHPDPASVRASGSRCRSCFYCSEYYWG